MVKRLVIGMSGASGSPIAVELLRQIRSVHPETETHLVVTRSAALTLKQESGMSVGDLTQLASSVHSINDIGASIASGSFHTMGMVIVPCSMKTIAGIVTGYSDNLLLRAADVCLKERRKLVLVARESPFSTVHLRNLYEASQLGAVILPPMLTYYQGFDSLRECTCYTAARILSQFDLNEADIEWRGMNDTV